MPESGGNSENMLYYGDNLDVLRLHVKDETVDLVYLDPPFKSNQDYNVLFAEKNGTQSAAQIMAFEDTWHWDSVALTSYEEAVTSGGRVADAMESFKRFLGQSDMMAYLSMMAPRILEMKRTMKDSASIYLHCDPTASHYLKMLMDAVFGPENFQNEVIWKRTHSHGGARRYGPVHDTILFYSKSSSFKWNEQKTPYSDDYIEKFFRFEDSDGRRYRSTILTGPGVRHGSSGKPWRGIDPTTSGRHWAVPGYVRHLLSEADSSDVQAALDELDSMGRILWPKKKGGTPSFKQYVDDMGGVDLQDVWTDLPPISAQAKERLGYPTQKPEALLERIIRASSDEGDTVLDPFCGCGTTISVAQRLNRRWIGIDITHLAIALMKRRLRDAFDEDVTYRVVGEPTDLAGAINLAKKDRDMYQFQWWALELVEARPVEQKKGADKGIDGRLYFFVEKGKAEQIIFSVKGGSVTLAHVRELIQVVDKQKAAIGVLISLEEPTGPMRAEAADAGLYTSAELGNPKYQRIQLLTIEQLLSGKTVDCPRSVRYTGANPTFKKAPRAKREKKQKETQSKLSAHS